MSQYYARTPAWSGDVWGLLLTAPEAQDTSTPRQKPRPTDQPLLNVSAGCLSASIPRAILRQRRELAGRANSDRKSTRLNSSHANISYAVLCLQKNRRQHRSPVTREAKSCSAKKARARA